MSLYKYIVTHGLKILFALLCSISLASASASELDKDTDGKKKEDNISVRTVSVPVFSKESKKEFDDVVEDLLISIGEHNFRLNQHARIGRAIARREEIPFPAATVLHFCNLGYAKELLELAPDYLLRMPCRISIRQKEDKTIILEVWLLPEDDKRTLEFAKKINTILKEIVSYGAN